MAFSITAKSGTDLWRKPPSTDVYNETAPTAAHENSVIKNPLKEFVSATVSFRFTPQTRYDQAGIVLALYPTDSAATTSTPPKWIKTGIEYYQDALYFGTVGTDAYSDWSISPVSAEPSTEFVAGETWATLSVEKNVDELGDSLWVYQVVGERKLPLREINWPFGYGDAWDVQVEAYAAKPGEGEPLTVEFKDFAIKWNS
ncbi:hypothetical protein S40288_00996 [Stachybotrys chartarum IBT 40288]|nr:hypothetical protein S40288_00996 [Stachybotrys chartarum IBT 40288]